MVLMLSTGSGNVYLLTKAIDLTPGLLQQQR
jgi:hypothetical protein